MEASTDASEHFALLELPAELLIEILERVLKFPNGIDSGHNQEALDYITTIEKNLCGTVMASAYQNNKVILKPKLDLRNEKMASDGGEDDGSKKPPKLSILCPKGKNQAEKIQELEMKIELGTSFAICTQTCQSILLPQIDLLARIASGELGFSRLRLLVLDFRAPEGSKPHLVFRTYLDHLAAFCQLCGKFEFPLEGVHIKLESTDHPKRTKYKGELEGVHAALSNMLKVKPRQTEPLESPPIIQEGAQ